MLHDAKYLSFDFIKNMIHLTIWPLVEGFWTKKHEDGEIWKLYKVIQNVTVLSP